VVIASEGRLQTATVDSKASDRIGAALPLVCFAFRGHPAADITPFNCSTVQVQVEDSSFWIIDCNPPLDYWRFGKVTTLAKDQSSETALHARGVLK
jgi:hypothetical protein